jgi:hypothetical protein
MRERIAKHKCIRQHRGIIEMEAHVLDKFEAMGRIRLFGVDSGGKKKEG